MYEDSIQELNNLIGELDSFQREHDQIIKQKQQSKPYKCVENTTADTTVRTAPIEDASDTPNGLDNSSTYRNNDRNALMYSPAANDSAFFNEDSPSTHATDFPGATLSRQVNLSSIEHPAVMQMNCRNTKKNSTGNSYSGTLNPGSPRLNALIDSQPIVSCIELIPDSYNVSDDYVKEHSEIVLLRRTDSQNDDHEHDTNHALNIGTAAVAADKSKRVKHTSSFRCSSFVKTDSNCSNHTDSTLKHGPPSGSPEPTAFTATATRSKAKEAYNGAPMMTPFDQDRGKHEIDNSNAVSQTIRQKPIITPRPTSLSGLFSLFVCLIFLS